MCVKDDLTIPGEVYKAKDTRLDRTVAIKVLPSELAQDPGRRERFEREARAVASLNHPHICTLYDIGRENGIDFLVMEHIEGETLADVLRKGALPLDRALRAGIQLADALDKAHRQGVVHRDVKPGNIMLSSGVKLLDFGLARSRPKAELAADSESPTKHKPLTEEGALLGTVPYMAPEQLEGKEADERTDIFALGAVLYEMVSGKRLSTIPRLSPELQPLCSPALSRIVQKCLAKDPEDRWQSARDLATELDWVERAGDEEQLLAPRSQPWLLWAAAFVAALGVTALVFWSLTERPSPEVTRMTFGLPSAMNLPDSTNIPFAISPDGRRLVFASRYVFAELGRLSVDSTVATA